MRSIDTAGMSTLNRLSRRSASKSAADLHVAASRRSRREAVDRHTWSFRMIAAAPGSIRSSNSDPPQDGCADGQPSRPRDVDRWVLAPRHRVDVTIRSGAPHEPPGRPPSARTIARLMTLKRDHLTKAETLTVAVIEKGAPALGAFRPAGVASHYMIASANRTGGKDGESFVD